ncbi:MAG TPA: PEP-CTERM sorting domain-containing protein [Gemmatimonadales bacterium]
MKTPSVLVRSLAALSLLAGLVAAPASAQNLFFNGTPNGLDALSSDFNTGVSQSMVYDDFVVGGSGWNVTDLYGLFVGTVQWQGAQWEIRSGMSTGNGGTLVQSGSGAVTQTDELTSPFSLEEYQAHISGLSFFLAPGTYWMGISVVGNGTGGDFVTTTSGASGVNSNINGSGFWNSSFFAVDFVPTTDVASDETDFSYGIGGTLADVSSVPEPSTMALLATGLVGMAGAGMKRRRRK